MPSEGTERTLSLLWKKEESSHPVQEFPVQLMSTVDCLSFQKVTLRGRGAMAFQKCPTFLMLSLCEYSPEKVKSLYLKIP